MLDECNTTEQQQATKISAETGKKKQYSVCYDAHLAASQEIISAPHATTLWRQVIPDIVHRATNYPVDPVEQLADVTERSLMDFLIRLMSELQAIRSCEIGPYQNTMEEVIITQLPLAASHMPADIHNSCIQLEITLQTHYGQRNSSRNIYHQILSRSTSHLLLHTMHHHSSH